MMELDDSRQQLKFISEGLQAIRSVALMADEYLDWDAEGDIVRLIALAVEPIMRDMEEVIAKLDAIIKSESKKAEQQNMILEDELEEALIIITKNLCS